MLDKVYIFYWSWTGLWKLSTSCKDVYSSHVIKQINACFFFGVIMVQLWWKYLMFECYFFSCTSSTSPLLFESLNGTANLLKLPSCHGSQCKSCFLSEVQENQSNSLFPITVNPVNTLCCLLLWYSVNTALEVSSTRSNGFI